MWGAEPWVVQSLRPGDWMVSIDLQVPVYPKSRRYMRFCLGQQTFQFRVLCFGLSSASVHPCHGPGLLHYAWLWLSDPPLHGRLARPRILFPGDNAGERLPLVAVSGVRDSHESLQELSHSCSIFQLFGYDSTVEPFEGFPDPSTDPEGALSRRRVLLLSASVTHNLALSPRCHVFDVRSRSRIPSLDEVVTTSPQRCGSSDLRGHVGLLGQLLPPGSSVVVRCRPSRGRSSPCYLPRPDLLLYTDVSDSRWVHH